MQLALGKMTTHNCGRRRNDHECGRKRKVKSQTCRMLKQKTNEGVGGRTEENINIIIIIVIITVTP